VIGYCCGRAQLFYAASTPAPCSPPHALILTHATGRKLGGAQVLRLLVRQQPQTFAAGQVAAAMHVHIIFLQADSAVQQVSSTMHLCQPKHKNTHWYATFADCMFLDSAELHGMPCWLWQQQQHIKVGCFAVPHQLCSMDCRCRGSTPLCVAWQGPVRNVWLQRAADKSRCRLLRLPWHAE
jgi:hypothetical protein